MKKRLREGCSSVEAGRQRLDYLGSSVVELLIVIMLIVVLAALSMAVFGSYRASALNAQCISNLRQIGAGLAGYVAEHGGVYPHYNDDYELDEAGMRVKVRTRKWNTLLVAKGYLSDRKVFICGAAKGTAPLALVDSGMISYGYNLALARDLPNQTDWFSPRARLTNVPAGMIIAADASETGRWDDGFMHGSYILSPNVQKGAGAGVAYPRHNGVCNVLWGDGRVSGVRASDPNDYRTLYEPDALGDMYSHPQRWLRQRD